MAAPHTRASVTKRRWRPVAQSSLLVLRRLEALRNDDIGEPRAGEQDAGRLDPGVDQEFGVDRAAHELLERAATDARLAGHAVELDHRFLALPAIAERVDRAVIEVDV